MDDIKQVLFFDDETNLVVTEFGEEVRFHSFSAFEEVLEVIRIPGANWAKAITYYGGEYGDYGYEERLYRMTDGKWKDVTPFILDVGLGDPEERYRRFGCSCYDPGKYKGKKFSEEIRFWTRRNDIRMILVNCDPLDLCSFPVFRSRKDCTLYAKEAYEIACCEASSGENVSTETIRKIFQYSGRKTDDGVIDVIAGELHGDALVQRCPVCRNLSFTDSKEQEVCTVCGEIRTYDQCENWYIYSAPEGSLAAGDRELVYYLRRNGKKEETDRLLSEYRTAADEKNPDHADQRNVRPGRTDSEEDTLSPLSRKLTHLFMDSYMRYTPETEEWIMNLVYSRTQPDRYYSYSDLSGRQVLLALIDFDSEPSDTHTDPKSITFEELAEFPQNGIPEHLVYALKRRDICHIRDLKSVSGDQLLKIPGVGKRGFCSICRMVRLFGDPLYGKSMTREMEHTLPPYRELVESQKLDLGMLRSLQEDGIRLPDTDWRWLEEHSGKSLLNFFEERHDPEGYLSYVAALFDEGYSVRPYVEVGYGCCSYPEEYFCLKETGSKRDSSYADHTEKMTIYRY